MFNRDGGVRSDRKSVKRGGVVVDVDGGFGSPTMIDAHQNPQLKFVPRIASLSSSRRKAFVYSVCSEEHCII